MLKLLETIKDSAESTFDSAASRIENVHRLIGGYIGDRTRGLRGVADGSAHRARAGQEKYPENAARSSIYDVIRGVNREIGEFGTDVFEIIDDARARRGADKRRDRDHRE